MWPDFLILLTLEGEKTWNDWTPFIVVGSTILGMIISYLTFVRNRDAGIQKDARESERINENLKHISNNVSELKNDFETGRYDYNEKNDKAREDITRIDEGLKALIGRFDRKEKQDNYKRSHTFEDVRDRKNNEGGGKHD